jgi:hypothetical protein
MLKKVLVGILITIGILSTIFVIVVIVDMSNDPKEIAIEDKDTLSDVYRKEFIDGCVQDTPKMTPFCNCMVKYLEDNFTGTEIVNMKLEAEETGKVTKGMVDAGTECKVLVPDNIKEKNDTSNTTNSLPKSTKNNEYNTPVLLTWSGETAYCKPEFADFAKQSLDNIKTSADRNMDTFNKCMDKCSATGENESESCKNNYSGELGIECLEKSKDRAEDCFKSCKNTYEDSSDRLKTVIATTVKSLSGKCAGF